MAAALPGAGEVAASVPLYVEDVEADVGRFVPLCVAPRIDTAALKLKMRLDGDNEVFQQWEQLEEEDGGVSTGVADPAPATSLGRGRGGGRRVGGGGGTRGRGAKGGDGGRGGPATLLSPFARHCTTGEIKGYNPERARPVAFDLHQECQFISSPLVTCHHLLHLCCIRIDTTRPIAILIASSNH